MRTIPIPRITQWLVILVIGGLGVWLALPNQWYQLHKPALPVPATFTPIFNPQFIDDFAWTGGTKMVVSASMSALPSSQRTATLKGVADTITRRLMMAGYADSSVVPTRFNQHDTVAVEIPRLPYEAALGEYLTRPVTIDFRIPGPDSNNLASGAAALYFQSFRTTSLDTTKILQAAAQTDPATKKPIIVLQFNEEGTKLLTDFSTQYKGQTIAIFLDGSPLSVPTIADTISNGMVQISAKFTPEQAAGIARELNLVSLPITKKVITQVAVPPLFDVPTQGRMPWLILLMIGLFSIIILITQRSPWRCWLIMAEQTVWLIALLKILNWPFGLAAILGIITAAVITLATSLFLPRSTSKHHRSGIMLTLLVLLGWLSNPLMISWLPIDPMIRLWAGTAWLGLVLSWLLRTLIPLPHHYE